MITKVYFNNLKEMMIIHLRIATQTRNRITSYREDLIQMNIVKSRTKGIDKKMQQKSYLIKIQIAYTGIQTIIRVKDLLKLFHNNLNYNKKTNHSLN